MRTPKIALSASNKGSLFLKDYWVLYLMLIPVIAFYIVFAYGPMYGLLIAFKDYRPFLGIWNSPWVGFKHFETMFRDPFFWSAFKNTVILSIWKLVLGFPLPILLTLLINEIRSTAYKRVVQTVVYFPRFLSWIIVAAFFTSMLSTQNGVINIILQNLGLIEEPIYFMGRNETFRGVLIATDIWKSAGWGTVIYLAAISGINPEIYESAYLDGANRFQRMLFITLPCIMPSISIMLILQISALLNANFDQVVSMYNTQVYNVGDIIDTYVFRLGIQSGQVGFSTAVGLSKAAISTILLLLSDRVSKLLGQDGFI